MADNISKNYALNIEVSVDSSSLDSLKNIQQQKSVEPDIIKNYQLPQGMREPDDDVYDRFCMKLAKTTEAAERNAIAITRNPSNGQNPSIEDISRKVSDLIGKVEDIKNELVRRDDFKRSEHSLNASNLANSDISKNVAIQIVKIFNEAIERNIAKPFGNSMMSSNDNKKANGGDNGGGVSIENSSSLAKNIESTTGKRVSIQERKMGSGYSGEYDHASQTITINSNLSGNNKLLALNHESVHPVQESISYTNNNLLAMANSKTEDIKKKSAEYVNEYLTNTVALIKTAMAPGNDRNSIIDIVNKYNETVKGKSGIIIKDINKFINVISKISELNINPEVFLTKLSDDIMKLSKGDMTTLGSAAIAKKIPIGQDGTFDKKDLHRLKTLKNENGHRVSAADIASHNMAYEIFGHLDTLRGSSNIGNKRDILRFASKEIGSMSNFGVQIINPNRMAEINDLRMQYNGFDSIKSRVLDSTGVTHRGEKLMLDDGTIISGGSTIQTRARKPGNVRYGLRNDAERIAFAIGGDKVLNDLIKKTSNRGSFTKDDIMEYISSYIFEGTGTNETDFLNNSLKRNENGVLVATELNERYGAIKGNLSTLLDSYISDNNKSNFVFSGSNRLNGVLGDIVFRVKKLKQGIKRGYISDEDSRILTKKFETRENKDGETLNSIDNVPSNVINYKEMDTGGVIDDLNREKYLSIASFIKDKINKISSGEELGIDINNLFRDVKGLISTTSKTSSNILLPERIGGNNGIVEGEQAVKYLKNVLKLVLSSYSSYEREYNESYNGKARDEYLDLVEKVLFIMHPDKDMRTMSNERMLRDYNEFTRELSSISREEIDYANSNGGKISIGGKIINVKDLLEIKRGIENMNRNFGTSKMSDGRTLEDINNDIESSKSLKNIYKQEMKDVRKRLVDSYTGDREDYLERKLYMSNPEWKEFARKYVRQRERLAELEREKNEYISNKEDVDRIEKSGEYTRTVDGRREKRRMKFDNDSAAAALSIYSHQSGPYNFLSGNLDSLSTITGTNKSILERIRKNSSFGNMFVNGELQNWARPLEGAMDDKSFGRMKLLSELTNEILKISKEAIGNSPDRKSAKLVMDSFLGDYLHRGEMVPIKSLLSNQEMYNEYNNRLSSHGINSSNIEVSTFNRLIELINKFNTNSDLVRALGSGSRYIQADSVDKKDASHAREAAKEAAKEEYANTINDNNAVINSKNPYLNGKFNGKNLVLVNADGLITDSHRDFVGDKNIENDTGKLKKDLKLYKFVSDESANANDFFSGSASTRKDIYGIIDFLTKNNPDRNYKMYEMMLDKNSKIGSINLGNLDDYMTKRGLSGKEASMEVLRLTKAAQEKILNAGYDVAKVIWERNGKVNSEYTMADASSIKDVKEVDKIKQSIKDRMDLHRLSNSVSVKNGDGDVVARLSDNIKLLISKMSSSVGGVSPSVINKISEDVSSIRQVLSEIGSRLSGGTNGIKYNSPSGDNGSSPFGSSKMSANDEYKNDAAAEERRRRIERLKRFNDNNVKVEDFNKKEYDLKKSDFEASLAEAKTKEDKLRLIRNRMDEMKENISAYRSEEEYNISQKELDRLRKKAVSVESGTGTRIDRDDLRNWKTRFRRHGSDFILGLNGKDGEEVSKIINDKIENLKELIDTKYVEDYDRRHEILKFINKLKSFDKSNKIRSDKRRDSEIINELRDSFKKTDSEFDATIKGKSMSERFSLLKEEIDRVTESLEKLRIKKKEALDSGNENIYNLYSTLEKQREIRRNVLIGKSESASISMGKAAEAEAERAKREQMKDTKAERREENKLANIREGRGRQARSVFNKIVEYGAASALAYSFTSEVKNAIDIMAKFERQMVETTKVMDPIYESQNMLADSARKFAIEYGVSITSAAEAMTVFAQQGKNASEIVTLVNASLVSANTTTMTAAESTEALTAAIQQFNLSEKDSMRVIDSWLEVESRTAIDSKKLADAIKISGTAARIAGLSFDEFNGIVSAVGSATRESGSQLGTAFKFIISKMRTEDAVQQLQKLGIAVYNQDGEFRDLMAVLGDLNARWKDMSQEQRAATAISIAGTRRYNTLMTLMEQWGNALDAVKMSEDSHGKAMRMNTIVMDTYSKKIDQTRAKLESFYSTMMEGGAKPLLDNTQESIGNLVSFLDKIPFIKNIATMGVIGAGALGVARVAQTSGLNYAIQDAGTRADTENEVKKFINSRRSIALSGADSFFGRNFAIGSDNARRRYLAELQSYRANISYDEEVGDIRFTNQNLEKKAREIADKYVMDNNITSQERYQAVLKATREQIDRNIEAEYRRISSLKSTGDSFVGKLERGVQSMMSFLDKHKIAMLTIGAGLVSVANSELFRDKDSITGRNWGGETVNAIGNASISLDTALLAGSFVKGKYKIPAMIATWLASFAVTSGINLITKFFDENSGNERRALINIQREDDRIKSLQTAISNYQALVEKEKRGETLSENEYTLKRRAANDIMMLEPTLYDRNSSAYVPLVDDSKLEEIYANKDLYDQRRIELQTQRAYKMMFASGGGGQTASSVIMRNMDSLKREYEAAINKIEEFDAKNGDVTNLTEDQLEERRELIDAADKLKKSIDENSQNLMRMDSEFLALVRSMGYGFANEARTRSGKLRDINGTKEYREMRAELLKHLGGDVAALNKQLYSSFISGQFSGRTEVNSENAMKFAEKHGYYNAITPGKDTETQNHYQVQTVDLNTGSTRTQSVYLDKDKNRTSEEVMDEISRILGIDKESMVSSTEISNLMFRYSIKEIDEFIKSANKLSEDIYNAFSSINRRFDRIIGISSKYSQIGSGNQYMGSSRALNEYIEWGNRTKEQAGTYEEDIARRIIEISKSDNPSRAIQDSYILNSEISRGKNGNTLVGAIMTNNNMIAATNKKFEFIQQLIDAIDRGSGSIRTKPTDTDNPFTNVDLKDESRISEIFERNGFKGLTYAKLVSSMKAEGKSNEEIKTAIIRLVSSMQESEQKTMFKSIDSMLEKVEQFVSSSGNNLKGIFDTIQRRRNSALSSAMGNRGIIDERAMSYAYSSASSELSKVYSGYSGRFDEIMSSLNLSKQISENELENARKNREEVYRRHSGYTEADIRARRNADDMLAFAEERYNRISTALESTKRNMDAVNEAFLEMQSSLSETGMRINEFIKNIQAASVLSTAKDNKIYFGTGSKQIDELSVLSEQNSSLRNERIGYESRLKYLEELKSRGVDVDDKEISDIKYAIGKIDGLLSENIKKIEETNKILEQSHAERVKQTRTLQIEHLANSISRSKDTSSSQKAIYNNTYTEMRDAFRNIVSMYAQNPSAFTDSEIKAMQELGIKMENLRDIGDLLGNASFNKNYMLASGQDRAIADMIIGLKESGVSMKQIFSDVGMKELARNNPLVGQLLDDFARKEDNARLYDINNRMYDVQSSILSLMESIAKKLGNEYLVDYANKAEERNQSAANPGFASGTTYTGSGGKYQSAGLVEVHKGEGLGVLSQTAMARYPIMSKRVLKMISDMNTGTYLGFANGTVLSGDVFNYGNRNDLLGLRRDIELQLNPVSDGIRRLAEIMRVDINNIYTTLNGEYLPNGIAGFNQGGKIFIKSRHGESALIHEILHGSNGSQVASTNTAREAMSVFGEMAIGRTKTPGYGNIFTKAQYSELDFVDNPVKNATRIFNALMKNNLAQEQWNQINSDLKEINSGYATAKLGTKFGDNNFRQAYAQAAGVVAEYGLSMGLSTPKDVDRMFKKLDKLLYRVTGSSKVGFSENSAIGPVEAKIFAQAVSEFRKSIDKNGRIVDEYEVMARIGKESARILESNKKSSIFSPILDRFNNIKQNNFGNIKGLGVSIRDGKWRNYGLLSGIQERLIQSDLGSFVRAGGIGNLGNVALNYGRNVASTGINAAKSVRDSIYNGYDRYIATPTTNLFDKSVQYAKRAASPIVNAAGNINTPFTKVAMLNWKKVPLDPNNIDSSNLVNMKLRDLPSYLRDIPERYREWKLDRYRNGRVGTARTAYEMADSRFRREYNNLMSAKESQSSSYDNLRKLRSGEINPETRIERDLRQKSSGDRYLSDRNKDRIARLEERIRQTEESIPTSRENARSYRQMRRSMDRQFGDERNMSTRTRREARMLDARIRAEERIIREGRRALPGMRENYDRMYSAQRGLDYRAELSESKLESYRNNPVRAEHQRREAVQAAWDARRERRASESSVSESLEARKEARDNYVRERARNIKRIRRMRTPGRIAGELGGAVYNNAIKPVGRTLSNPFFLMNAKNVYEQGMMALNGGKVVDEYTGELRDATNEERVEAAFGAGTSAAYAVDQIIGVPKTKLGKVTGGLGLFASAAQAGNMLYNGDKWGALEVMTPALVYSPMARNVASKGMEKAFSGTSVMFGGTAEAGAARAARLNNFFKPGKSFGIGMGLDVGGQLAKQYFGENTVAGNVADATSKAGRLLSFASPGGALLQGGFNTGTELFKLYTNDKYAERAGEEVLEMGGGYGSMTLHALDTVLGGVIGFKEAAASRVMAKRAREEAAMDVWNNNISLKGDLNSILSRRMDSGEFNREDIGANVYSAVSAKNNFFASNGGKNLYSADALSILSMIEGKDAKDIFDEYGLTNIPKDNEIINRSKYIAKLMAEAGTLESQGQSSEAEFLRKQAREIGLLNGANADLASSHVEKARQSAQSYFDSIYGEGTNVFGENGLLYNLRKRDRLSRQDTARSNLKNAEQELVNARRSLFDERKGGYSYDTLEEMEYAAQSGDETAVKQLKDFEEHTNGYKYRGREYHEISGAVDARRKELEAIENSGVDMESEMTAQEFVKLSRSAELDPRARYAAAKKEYDSITSELSKKEEDLNTARSMGASEAEVDRLLKETEKLKRRQAWKQYEISSLKDDKEIQERYEAILKSSNAQPIEDIEREIVDFNRLQSQAQSYLDDANIRRLLSAEMKKAESEGRASEGIELEIDGKRGKYTLEQLKSMADVSGERGLELWSKLYNSLNSRDEIMERERFRQYIANTRNVDASTVSDKEVEDMIAQKRKEAEEASRKQGATEPNESPYFAMLEKANYDYQEALNAQRSNSEFLSSLTSDKENDKKIRELELKLKDDSLSEEDRSAISKELEMRKDSSLRSREISRRKDRGEMLSGTVSARKKAKEDAERMASEYSKDVYSGKAMDNEKVSAYHIAKRANEEMKELERIRTNGGILDIGTDDKGALTDEQWARLQEARKIGSDDAVESARKNMQEEAIALGYKNDNKPSEGRGNKRLFTSRGMRRIVRGDKGTYIDAGEALAQSAVQERKIRESEDAPERNIDTSANDADVQQAVSKEEQQRREEEKRRLREEAKKRAQELARLEKVMVTATGKDSSGRKVTVSAISESEESALEDIKKIIDKVEDKKVENLDSERFGRAQKRFDKALESSYTEYGDILNHATIAARGSGESGKGSLLAVTTDSEKYSRELLGRVLKKHGRISKISTAPPDYEEEKDSSQEDFNIPNLSGLDLSNMYFGGNVFDKLIDKKSNLYGPRIGLGATLSSAKEVAKDEASEQLSSQESGKDGVVYGKVRKQPASSYTGIVSKKENYSVQLSSPASRKGGDVYGFVNGGPSSYIEITSKKENASVIAGDNVRQDIEPSQEPQASGRVGFRTLVPFSFDKDMSIKYGKDGVAPAVSYKEPDSMGRASDVPHIKSEDGNIPAPKYSPKTVGKQPTDNTPVSKKENGDVQTSSTEDKRSFEDIKREINNIKDTLSAMLDVTNGILSYLPKMRQNNGFSESEHIAQKEGDVIPGGMGG